MSIQTQTNTASLNLHDKAVYAIGQIAVSTKDTLFHYFFLLFFSTALGLPASVVGATAFIALFFDAISDPVMGGISDNFRSKKWGRRHGFMLAAAIPLGLAIWLLFSPPPELSRPMLIAWMAVFAISIRLILSMFYVPFMALNAELTSSYDERTVLASLRTLCGSLVGISLFAFIFLVILKDTPAYPDGQLNPAAYREIGLIGGIIATTAILVSTLGTKKHIPNLRARYQEAEKLVWWSIYKDIFLAFKLKSYKRLTLGYVFVSILLGVATALTVYVFIYFWGLSKVQVFGLAVVAGLSVIPGAISANLIARKIGKRNTLLLAIAVLGIFHTAPIGLRLLGVLPPNGAPVLYFLVAGFLFISQTFAVVSTIIAQSMMADVADEYASVSGRHQQAGLFAAITFAQKTTFGIGVFFAGLVLDLVHFPVKTASTDIPNEVIRRMGAAEAISVIVLCICTFLAWSGYDLNKNRHEKIQNMLSNR